MTSTTAAEVEENLVHTNFARDKHIQYFLSHIKVVPHFYATQDLNRMTLLYFCVSALDVLDALPVIDDKLKIDILAWIKSMFLKHDPLVITTTSAPPICGFRGSCMFGHGPHPSNDYDMAHITMTYTALATLRVLGDDLSFLSQQDRLVMLQSIAGIQNKQGATLGCFSPTAQGTEQDIRFVYCATAISALLNDKTMQWCQFDAALAVQYIKSSRGYDFAYSHGPGLESHGGSTYCAISSLTNMYTHMPVKTEQDAQLKETIKQQLQDHQSSLVEWLLRRQVSGFQGRPQKDADTCYSFWIGATLAQLQHSNQYINKQLSLSFTMSCQNDKIGGFGKIPGQYPDVLHSYMALCGLSLIGYKGLQPLVPELGVTKRIASTFLQDYC